MEWSFDEIRGFIPKSISLPYSREEKNGYRSVLTGRDELNYIMLNGSGSYIVSLCDGKNTVETILNRMCDKFPDANPDMLKSERFQRIETNRMGQNSDRKWHTHCR